MLELRKSRIQNSPTRKLPKAVRQPSDMRDMRSEMEHTSIIAKPCSEVQLQVRTPGDVWWFRPLKMCGRWNSRETFKGTFNREDELNREGTSSIHVPFVAASKLLPQHYVDLLWSEYTDK